MAACQALCPESNRAQGFLRHKDWSKACDWVGSKNIHLLYPKHPINAVLQGLLEAVLDTVPYSQRSMTQKFQPARSTSLFGGLLERRLKVSHPPPAHLQGKGLRQNGIPLWISILSSKILSLPWTPAAGILHNDCLNLTLGVDCNLWPISVGQTSTFMLTMYSYRHFWFQSRR